MSHFASKLGVLLHFHPLTRFDAARESSTFHDESVPTVSPGRAARRDDLAYRALTAGLESSSPRADLGRFALLSADVPKRVRLESAWSTLD